MFLVDLLVVGPHMSGCLQKADSQNQQCVFRSSLTRTPRPPGSLSAACSAPPSSLISTQDCTDRSQTERGDIYLYVQNIQQYNMYFQLEVLINEVKMYTRLSAAWCPMIVWNIFIYIQMFTSLWVIVYITKHNFNLYLGKTEAGRETQMYSN